MNTTLNQGRARRRARPRKATHGDRLPLAVEQLEVRDMFAAEVYVSPLRGLYSSEDGGAAIISMKLKQQPLADVIVPISSSDIREGQVSASEVVFTPANWNVVQKIRVTGQPDGVKDGNKAYQLVTGAAISDDPAYNGMAVADPTITNRDSRKLLAGVSVSKTSGLVTSEDGRTASFTMKLNYRPTADVVISIASDNPREGMPNVTQVVFTPDNFDQPQMVTIVGVPDGVKDKTQTYHIVTGAAVSDDPLYNGMDVADVTAKNKNSKSLVAGVNVTPTSGLKTTEMGGFASFSIVLTYRPAAEVTIHLGSNNPGEGVPHVNEVTFTPDNWNVPKEIVVLGRDDGVFDGDVKYTIVTGAAVSSDPLYANREVADVSVTNLHRTDVARFDGIYVGSYSGKVTVTGEGTFPISGDVRAEIRGGVVIVTLPGSGGGTLSSSGTVGFGVTSGSVEGAIFSGSMKAEAGTPNASGMGTWKYTEPGVKASGFWNIRRVAD